MEFSTDTQNRVQFFKDKFRSLGYGDGHYVFACHAAFPIAFTPDLLYQIWANFKNYAGYLTIESPRDVDIIAVSDLLMSNLCFSTGNELFEMDSEKYRTAEYNRNLEDARFARSLYLSR